MVNIAETRPEHWKYISEGGATIVFSFIGPSNPHFDGMVLRLRKSALSTDDLQHESMEEPDDPMIEFQHKCMEKLIPPAHLPRLESVHLERKWLETMTETHDIARPERRRAADHIDLDHTKGVLATDLVGGNWMAVEIKPKWAFLPEITHLSAETAPIKSQTCRFCMHSSMKSKDDLPVSVGYCPLDLFSSNETRVKKALYSLWDAWTASNGTVNNLKIFVHGKAVSPSDTSPMLASNNTQGGTNAEDIREAFCSAILPLLTGTPVLHTLSKLQRTLDLLDIEGLSKLWHSAELSSPLYVGEGPGKTPTNPIGVSSTFLQAPDPDISDWVSFIDSYTSASHSTLANGQPDTKDLRFYMLAYLLSATFKDCSIIVRMDILGEKPVPKKEEVKQGRVTIIDLDPKSMVRLQKWEKLDSEIVNAYAGVQAKKVCIDDWKDN